MKKQIGLLLALWLAAAAFLPSAHAAVDSSYVLFQGPFGASGAEETFKFRINYQAGALDNGQDLLDHIFGAPMMDGTDPASGTPLLFAGTAAQNVQYDQYVFGGVVDNQVVAITFNSVTVKADDNTPSGPTQDWAYYVAGGAGEYNGGPYSTGSWTYANDGEDTRTLGNNSFDGWAFGDSGYDADGTPDGDTVEINGMDTNNAPTDADFTSATLITVVPEPETNALLLGGAALLWRWRKRGA